MHTQQYVTSSTHNLHYKIYTHSHTRNSPLFSGQFYNVEETCFLPIHYMSVRENLPSHTGSYNFQIPTEEDYSMILLHLGLFCLGRSRIFPHSECSVWMGFLNACSRKCILLGEAYILIHTYNVHSGRLLQFCPHLFNSGGLLGLLNRFGPWKLEVK